MIDLNPTDKHDFDVFLERLKLQLTDDEYKVVMNRFDKYTASDKIITMEVFNFYLDGFIDATVISNMKVDKGLIAAGYKKA